MLRIGWVPSNNSANWVDAMSWKSSIRWILVGWFVQAMFVQMGLAAGSVCARVEIEIEQELTLEREGFEARLGIVNGLPSSLDNFRVTLTFTDAEGRPVAVSTDAAPNDKGLFYHRVQTGYTLPSSVAAGANQKVAFLIVPALGAAGDDPAGTLYYVGATVKYDLGGQEQIVEIAPDFIHVKPMPTLELQYFLPGDVYGDDPMTEDAVESIVPFPLGVRVINHSPLAYARKVSIQSCQPKIVRNDSGLLIDFRIVGAQVNGTVSEPTLLANFGDISPRRAAMGSWIMVCSLSGKFVEFSAEMTHAPEFGGALTSLIPADAVTCRRLVGRVLVDLPDRDQIPDFLACENMTGAIRTVTLHESSTEVPSVPVDCFPLGDPLVRLTETDEGCTLAVQAVSPLLFVQAASPVEADMTVCAVRSDGKVLAATNCWISKSKDSALRWQYSVNLFDTNKADGQTYALSFSAPVPQNRAPRLTIVGGRTFHVAPGSSLYVDVVAQDPDGTIPMLSTALLPDGAHFTDSKNGRGYFAWAPAAGREGTYAIQFKASDGALSDIESATVVVAATTDVGYSGWCKQFWPGVTDPGIIGAEADPDGDGINNLMEYALGSDPTYSDQSLLPWLKVETVDGKRYLTLLFWRRTDADDLNYKVLASDTLFAPLASWQPQTLTEVVDESDTPHGYECVKVRDSISIEDSPGHRYLRLWVELKKAGAP